MNRRQLTGNNLRSVSLNSAARSLQLVPPARIPSPRPTLASDRTAGSQPATSSDSRRNTRIQPNFQHNFIFLWPQAWAGSLADHNTPYNPTPADVGAMLQRGRQEVSVLPTAELQQRWIGAPGDEQQQLMFELSAQNKQALRAAWQSLSNHFARNDWRLQDERSTSQRNAAILGGLLRSNRVNMADKNTSIWQLKRSPLKGGNSHVHYYCFAPGAHADAARRAENALYALQKYYEEHIKITTHSSYIEDSQLVIMDYSKSEMVRVRKLVQLYMLEKNQRRLWRVQHKEASRNDNTHITVFEARTGMQTSNGNTRTFKVPGFLGDLFGGKSRTSRAAEHQHRSLSQSQASNNFDGYRRTQSRSRSRGRSSMAR